MAVTTTISSIEITIIITGRICLAIMVVAIISLVITLLMVVLVCSITIVMVIICLMEMVITTALIYLIGMEIMAIIICSMAVMHSMAIAWIHRVKSWLLSPHLTPSCTKASKWCTNSIIRLKRIFIPSTTTSNLPNLYSKSSSTPVSFKFLVLWKRGGTKTKSGWLSLKRARISSNSSLKRDQMSKLAFTTQDWWTLPGPISPTSPNHKCDPTNPTSEIKTTPRTSSTTEKAN